MEQVCHRCGATLPFGTSFCGQCGAPQVRVPETVMPLVAADSSSSIQDLPVRSSDTTLNWRHALPSASTAGLAMAIASLVPAILKLFPIWMLAGGGLAVFLYHRRSSLLLLTNTIGGKIGALAGLLGFLFFGAFMGAYITITTVILHRGEELRAMLRSSLQEAAAASQDPRVQTLVQLGQTPEGLAAIVACSMFVFLLSFLLFSTAGGLFAASLSRRKLR